MYYLELYYGLGQPPTNLVRRFLYRNGNMSPFFFMLFSISVVDVFQSIFELSSPLAGNMIVFISIGVVIWLLAFERDFVFQKDQFVRLFIKKNMIFIIRSKKNKYSTEIEKLAYEFISTSKGPQLKIIVPADEQDVMVECRDKSLAWAIGTSNREAPEAANAILKREKFYHLLGILNLDDHLVAK